MNTSADTSWSTAVAVSSWPCVLNRIGTPSSVTHSEFSPSGFTMEKQRTGVPSISVVGGGDLCALQVRRGGLDEPHRDAVLGAHGHGALALPRRRRPRVRWQITLPSASWNADTSVWDSGASMQHVLAHEVAVAPDLDGDRASAERALAGRQPHVHPCVATALEAG